ncbi:hypothetical protein AAHU43_19920 [Klebsiella variicola subsp. variicola]|uniref:hypothetical protein n=1 Tax=Klebsiella variicola TaxID=244366 RepID=UPI0035A1AE8B
MKTDITELAQSLKAAAEKWQEAWGKYDKVEITIAEFIRAAEQYESIVKDPANILALVEALEKAQQVNEELCKLLPPGAEYMDPPDGGDVTPLEGVRRMVADYRQRIVELESRTVKLVDCDFGAVQHMSGGSTDYCHGFVDGTQNAIRAISAAGIKVEAE